MMPLVPNAWKKSQAVLFVLATALVSGGGCTAPTIRSQSPDLDELADFPDRTQLVEDLARPTGMKWVKVESVGLVNQLAGTGSDPPPSSRRSILLNEMKAHEVEDPNGILASPRTSLVLVRGILPPGIRKGDPIDIEVTVPSRSETTSLEGGWLMPTRLREMAVLNNRIATGHELAIAQGRVFVDALTKGTDDTVWLTRGRVLGGGLSLTTRSLGLVVRSEHHSVRTSAQIGSAINARFHTYDHGSMKGVATPKRDNFVQLMIHPRYQDNLLRYIRVIQSIPVREDPADRVARIEQLKQSLQAPETAARAAIRLEALNEDGTLPLLAALQSRSKEVRFYAAEALAYLDNGAAAPVLADSAGEPAFRWRALTALGAMEDPKAYDALSELLHVPSVETRYGAFRILVDLGPNDPQVAGTNLNGVLNLHTVSSTAEPLVHIVTHGQHPEIVLFGGDHILRPPVLLFAGKSIIVKGDTPYGMLTVSRYSAEDDADQTEQCEARLDVLIRTLVKLGASYPDVVRAIQQAKQNGCLASRIEFDKIPKLGRTYYRDEEGSTEDESAEDADWRTEEET